MDYLSIDEVVEIKGCSKRYIQKLCQTGKIEAIQQTHYQNKCMCYMIPVSALTEQEQVKYYEKIKREAGIPPAEKKQCKTLAKPLKEHKKTFSKPFEEYSESERNDISFWCGLLEEWQNRRSGYESKTEFDRNFIGECRLKYDGIEISTGILYRRYNAYKNNDLDGIIGKRGGSNRNSSMIPPQIWEAFLWYYFGDMEKQGENKPTISQSYRNTKDWCIEFCPELFEAIPTERTFRRHIESDIAKAVKIYMRDGEKAMNDRCAPYVERMYDELHANDVWIADNHTLDILIENEDGTTKTRRIYITAFQDAKSGVIVGWNLTESPNSQSTILALRHAIMRFGIPKMVYFDNGREFLNHDIGGNGHRTHKKKNDTDDIPTPTILKRLGIEMRNAIVRNAKAKPIERTFCTVKNQFSKAWETYCGGTPAERPESIKRRIKKGEIPKDYQIRDTLDLWIDGDYNVQDYCGREKKYKGLSRIDVWNTDIKNVGVRQASESDLNLMLMRSTRHQKIKRNGVFVEIAGEKLWYMDKSETYKYLDTEVFVRYNPADLREVRIYDINDRYLFTWKNADELLVDYITDKKEEIQNAEKLQREVKRYIRNDGRNLTCHMSDEQKISALNMLIRRSKSGMKKFNIEMPARITIVQSGEPLAKAAGAENIDCVEINLEKMIQNQEKRKGE